MLILYQIRACWGLSSLPRSVSAGTFPGPRSGVGTGRHLGRPDRRKVGKDRGRWLTAVIALLLVCLSVCIKTHLVVNDRKRGPTSAQKGCMGSFNVDKSEHKACFRNVHQPGRPLWNRTYTLHGCTHRFLSTDPPKPHPCLRCAFLILCYVWSMDNGLGIQHPGAMSPGANVHLAGWGWGADSSLGLSKKKSLNKFLSPFPTPLGGSQGQVP